jgi:hypothetical protein
VRGGFPLERTGYGRVVDHVASRRNNATVFELADEPGLGDWLDRQGITLAEAARIQPTYGHPGDGDPRRIGPMYAGASIAGVGLSALGTALNLSSQTNPRRAGGLAFLAGATTLALGAAKLGNGGAARTLGWVDVSFGALATLVGINALTGSRHSALTTERRRVRASITPIVAGATGAGLGVRIQF